MKNIFEELRYNIDGDVYDDVFARRIYSVDASIYEIMPLGIVVPRTFDDLHIIHTIATAHNIPIIARGAGTGITGGCLGNGLIVDTSRYLNKILEVNYDKGYARCEPGVVQDQLNKILAEKGHHLGPDTSTSNRATIGGMIANNASGSHSLRYGTMSDHVIAVSTLLSNGDKLLFSSLTEKELVHKKSLETREGDIYRAVDKLSTSLREEILTRYPPINRCVSGYNFNGFVRGNDFNIAKLIVGSEGTLGTIAEAKVNIIPKPAYTGLCIIHFDDLVVALEAVTDLLHFDPYAIELIDNVIIEAALENKVLFKDLSWLKGSPKAILAVEFEGSSHKQIREKIAAMHRRLPKKSLGYAATEILEAPVISSVWQLRKAGLGLLMSKRSFNRAIAFLEDIAVAPEKLPAFIVEFQAILDSYHKRAGIYGHAGAGCLHIRPFIDLRNTTELAQMQSIMEKTAELILKYQGALSGEHGDGLLRSWLNKKMFGEDIYDAFGVLKSAFDPHNRMNPGKIVDAPPLLKNLRLSPESRFVNIPTTLDFSPEGGFNLAIDMCNGDGECRKKEGLMCPSFQATGDERHTTRARAQSLRAIIHGKEPLKAFSSKELYDVLDLCFQCKGCKTECPSHVDMAKIKAEFLHHYQNEHGYSLRTLIFGYIGLLSRFGSMFAPFSNWFVNTKLAKNILNRIGITNQRSFPKFSKETFTSWAKKHYVHPGNREGVVLFVDTFTEYNVPHIGHAAIDVLSAIGYDVIIPKYSCCGRPMISKGMLKQAKRNAEKLIKRLYPLAKQGYNIVGLEPSCILTIKDEYRSLVPSPEADKVSEMCMTIDEFIYHHCEKNPSLPFGSLPGKTIKIHTHCHQKSLVGSSYMTEVLRKIPGTNVQEIDSGCCGMGGAFGYEKEHYDLSMKIAQKSLLPAIGEVHDNTLLVVNGFSCRGQFDHVLETPVHHFIEILAQSLL